MIEALDRSVETKYCTLTFEGIHEMRVNGKPAAANGLSGYLVTMKVSEEIPDNTALQT